MWESKDDSRVATVDQLEQHYVLSQNEARDAYLVEVVRTFRSGNENGSIMIFTDTCK